MRVNQRRFWRAGVRRTICDRGRVVQTGHRPQPELLVGAAGIVRYRAIAVGPLFVGPEDPKTAYGLKTLWICEGVIKQS